MGCVSYLNSPKDSADLQLQSLSFSTEDGNHEARFEFNQTETAVLLPIHIPRTPSGRLSLGFHFSQACTAPDSPQRNSHSLTTRLPSTEEQAREGERKQKHLHCSPLPVLPLSAFPVLPAHKSNETRIRTEINFLCQSLVPE